MQDNGNGINNGRVGSWDNWALYVVKTLKRVEAISEKNHDELIILKTKVAVIGAASGIIFGGLTTLLINIIMK